MATFKIEINKEQPGLSLLNGDNALLIEADDATDARAIVDVLTATHESAGAWANETLVLVPSDDCAPVVNPQRGTVHNFVMTMTVAGADTNATFTETGAAGDTFSELLDKMVIQIDAHADIAASTWATPLFTVAEIADDIGDHTLTVTWQLDGTEIASVVGAIVDGGIAGAVLTVTFSTGVTVPSAQFYQS
jgi:hypothetical protein